MTDGRATLATAGRIALEAAAILGRVALSYVGGPPTRGVMVLIENRHGEVLLVKNRYRRQWTLPGGWVEPREDFEHGARREVLEETGYAVGSTLTLVAESGTRRHVDRLYRADVLDRPPTSIATPWEIAATQWRSRDDLPPLAGGPRRMLDLSASKGATR